MKVVLLALASLFLAPSMAMVSIMAPCHKAAVAYPPNEPWAGHFYCAGKTCTTGTCEQVIVPTGPNTFHVFCSCDGSEPACCHVRAVVDVSGEGTVDFEAVGSCEDPCPTGNTTCYLYTFALQGQGDPPPPPVYEAVVAKCNLL